MVERMEIDGHESSSSGDSILPKIVGVPLLLDDNPMDEVDDELLEEFEEDIVRHRAHAARTLFRQQRGDNDTVNSTRSLYDTDIVYFHIHGRRYCGDYYMPNDEDEQTRLQILHSVYLHTLSNKLTTIPLISPTKILDIGTGTGEWAMSVADLFPSCEVIGTDIAKIQPSAVPLNVFFEIDDAEEEGGWTWPEDEFDLVHFRGMQGAFCDWRGIYAECYRHLKPGGFVEVLDFDNANAFADFFAEDEVVWKWLGALNEAGIKNGRSRGAEHLDENVLRELGFVDVTKVEKRIPMGVWPDEREDQKVGKHFLIAMLCGVEAFCLRPLAETLGWDVDDVRELSSLLTEVVRDVALDPVRGRGLSFRLQVLTGRKPLVGEVVRGVLQGGIRGGLFGPDMLNANGGRSCGDSGLGVEREAQGQRVMVGGEKSGFLEVEGSSCVDGDSVRTMTMMNSVGEMSSVGR